MFLYSVAISSIEVKIMNNNVVMLNMHQRDQEDTDISPMHVLQ